MSSPGRFFRGYERQVVKPMPMSEAYRCHQHVDLQGKFRPMRVDGSKRVQTFALVERRSTQCP